MTDYSFVRGFNYQPGYAYNSYEAWRFFDAETFRRELTWGKRAFPGFNTVRYWLSYDAFRYEEDRQRENFETALGIADSLRLKAVPVLFNRWHDYNMDNGGIYIDQFVPESSWCSGDGRAQYKRYISNIVGDHRHDERILAWDMCNEPFSYGADNAFTAVVRGYEKAWLEDMYGLCRAQDASAPVIFSPFRMDVSLMEEYAPICDVFLLHRYDFDYGDPEERIRLLTNELSALAETARNMGKGIFTTETCWGSLSDRQRAEYVRVSLQAHKNAGLGFIAHALAYSHVADLHNPEDGVVGNPGNLCFLNPDGSVRAGHEIFNQF